MKDTMEFDATRSRARARALGLIAVAGLLAAACAPAASTAPSAEAPSAAPTEGAASPSGEASPSAATGPSAELIAAAQTEGALTAIALPDDWCNYAEVISTFEAKYGIDVTVLDPLAGSGEEIEAIKANVANPGPQNPDVVDVGYAFGEANKDLFLPYKVSTWDSIPESAKSADGSWYGDYYGVMSFVTNTEAIPNPPKDWSDLLKPEYKNAVALDGDPRNSNQAIQAVIASGLANGGTLDDATKGLDFWKQIVDAGNFVPVDANPATILSGATPIALQWSYNGLPSRDANPQIDVTVPTTGRFGGVYVQAINKTGPHPNAAKLWMEHLYSDEGQLLWLKGYCNPIRYDDMVARGVVPADLAAKLPDSTGAVFPTPAQLEAATKLITTGWDAATGATVITTPAPAP
ncbi:MAG TPA: extracellular solute-binding protein [Candidatus Limnocylindrales bacterium]